MCLSDRSDVYVFALLAKMKLSFKHFIFTPVCVRAHFPASIGVWGCITVVCSLARQ